MTYFPISVCYLMNIPTVPKYAAFEVKVLAAISMGFILCILSI